MNAIEIMNVILMALVLLNITALLIARRIIKEQDERLTAEIRNNEKLLKEYNNLRKEKSKMLVKIVDSTNQDIKKHIGETRRYFKLGNKACLEDLNKPGYGIMTSYIINEKVDENNITLETENSTYKLEIVEVSNNESI